MRPDCRLVLVTAAAAAAAPRCLGLRTSAAVPGLSNPFIGRRSLTGSAALAVGAAVLPTQSSDAVVKVDPSQVKSTPGGVKYVVVKEGNCPAADPTGLAGSCSAEVGSLAIIDYTGFLPSGDVFDSTERKDGKPLAFKLGQNQVIKGIEEVVLQMKPGEEVQALIPAALAYGSKGVCNDNGECLIKPDTSLKYFIRLKRVAVVPG
eukprot:CAMPEP_0119406880 /NCGR_PEP_ID=MMETSP1335-20130426/1037_1 /TAXON_ID=259385 /ORGANISM="Chrysoculter rhomboideus, Strain RCC1486" /LENGTH=204 /DNA_ID=CAMNT_0007430973 /DNA_START=14 /DNA_END=628 /DNA_ORIENTATION=+